MQWDKIFPMHTNTSTHGTLTMTVVPFRPGELRCLLATLVEDYERKGCMLKKCFVQHLPVLSAVHTGLWGMLWSDEEMGGASQQHPRQPEGKHIETYQECESQAGNHAHKTKYHVISFKIRGVIQNDVDFRSSSNIFYQKIKLRTYKKWF